MRTYTISAITLLAFSFSSCKKFLKEDPKSLLLAEEFYQTPAEVETAVNASYFFYNGAGTSGTGQTAYNSLLNVGMDFATDELDPGPGATNPDVRSLSVHNHSSTNRTFYENWQQHYAGIKKANVALEAVAKVDFGSNTALKNRLRGEALFNRAWIYFNVVRLWGDVPLITEVQRTVNVQDYYVAKSPQTVVYAQIESDLKEAAALLPNGPLKFPSDGRATQGAAKALLAHVYVTKASYPLRINAHYQDAVNQAEQVLAPAEGGTGNYGYALRTNYAEVYLPANENNSEHIFSAQYLGNNQSQGRNDFSRSLPKFPTGFGVIGGYADQVHFYTKGNDKSFSIWKLYSPKDKRRDVSFATSFTSPTSGAVFRSPIANPAYPNDAIPYLNKAFDPGAYSTAPAESGANLTLLKYSEVLLIHAEAENEANGPTEKAYASINKIRSRAGLADLTVGLTQDQFRDSVYLERRLEIVWEYKRWFDLIRQRNANGSPSFVDNLHAVGKINAVDRNRLFPIPQIELDNNPKLTQNLGW